MSKRILFCNLFYTYTAKQVSAAFREIGFEVVERFYPSPGDIYRDEEAERRLDADLRGDLSFVFSINFYPLLARLCFQKGIKYAAWTYDTPMNLPVMQGLEYETNYLFIFDRGEYEKFFAMGIPHVFHLPLASACGQEARGGEKKLYDVSFLGSLYRSRLLGLLPLLSQYEIGYINALLDAQQRVYGGYFIPDALTDELMEGVNRSLRGYSQDGGRDGQAPSLTKAQLSYMIAGQITWMDRISLLSIFSKRHRTALVTKHLEEDERELLRDVELLPPVPYDDGMDLFFRSSRINLNPPLRCVWSAIPQRALDIMSCGGFLLSGYTEELAGSFRNGEECVLYDSIGDAAEKAEYYLSHEAERERVARAGMEKVRKSYTYRQRAETIVQCVGCTR